MSTARYFSRFYDALKVLIGLYESMLTISLRFSVVILMNSLKSRKLVRSDFRPS
jgi:hypothetical protein